MFLWLFEVWLEPLINAYTLRQRNLAEQPYS